jgi:orotate phosphoribosyltransferase
MVTTDKKMTRAGPPRLAAAVPAHDHDEMDSGVIGLARPRRGHFDLGTGFHGDLWLDLDAVFLRPSLLKPHVDRLAERLRRHRIDAVCGPLEGGAFLAYALAETLDVAFLPAYRDQSGTGTGTAPAYRLPDVATDPGGIGGWRVAIADDAINAGTAVRACAGQLLSRGAVPVAVAALLSLGPASAAVAEGISVPLYTAGAVESRAWPAAQCPLCAGDIPFTELSPPGLCHEMVQPGRRTRENGTRARAEVAQ